MPTEADGEIGFDEAAGTLRDILVDSVRLHLRSDVPVGACLSGGIDSSAIVMTMRAVGGKNVDLHTFTYAADGTALNEEGFADVVGAAAGATMHKVRLEPGELVRDLDRLIADQDLPFVSTSIYAQHRVFAAARGAGIKVMLDGQGADEMLAGYPFYASARVASLVRGGELRCAASLLAHSTRTTRRAGCAACCAPRRRLFRRAFWQAAAGLIRRSRAGRGLNHRWFAERHALDDRSFWEHRSSLRAALAATFGETNLPALLRYEDRNSMAHSIESRVPFLTRSLAEFVFSLPERFLIAADGTSKSVLRAALRGLVPDAVLDRRDKIGFQTPEPNWLERIGRLGFLGAHERNRARHPGAAGRRCAARMVRRARWPRELQPAHLALAQCDPLDRADRRALRLIRSMMTQRDVYRLFGEIDRLPGIMEPRVGRWRAWPIAKMPLVWHLMQAREPTDPTRQCLAVRASSSQRLPRYAADVSVAFAQYRRMRAMPAQRRGRHALPAARPPPGGRAHAGLHLRRSARRRGTGEAEPCARTSLAVRWARAALQRLGDRSASLSFGRRAACGRADGKSDGCGAPQPS